MKIRSKKYAMLLIKTKSNYQILKPHRTVGQKTLKIYRFVLMEHFAIYEILEIIIMEGCFQICFQMLKPKLFLAR